MNSDQYEGRNDLDLALWTSRGLGISRTWSLPVVKMRLVTGPDRRAWLSWVQALRAFTSPTLSDVFLVMWFQCTNCDNNHIVVMASKTLILLLSVSCLHAEKHSKGGHDSRVTSELRLYQPTPRVTSELWLYKPTSAVDSWAPNTSSIA